MIQNAHQALKILRSFQFNFFLEKLVSQLFPSPNQGTVPNAIVCWRNHHREAFLRLRGLHRVFLIKMYYQPININLMKKYQEYRNLSSKIKQKKIDSAEQSEEFRKPNPQGIVEFQEYNFLDFFVIEDGKKIKLHTYRFNAIQEPLGVIVMFHGLNSHIGHGAHLAQFFSRHGFITVGFDYRGFGRSQGMAGYTQSLETHLKDCRQFLKMVSELYQKLPKFALGLSMGGMTAYHLSLNDPKLFDGVVLMAPALKNSINGFLIGMTSFLKTILPKKSRLTKPFYGRATKNPAITQFVKEDQYAFSQRVCLSTISMMVDVMDKSPKTFKDYKSPFIIFQGGLDKLVNPEVCFELFEKSSTPQEDKQIHFLEQMWHDIWHEEEIYEVMEKSLKWMLNRIKKCQSAEE